MTVNPSLGRAAACAALISCCSSLSFAADMPAPVVKTPPPEPSVWTYTVMPYAWLPSINGSTTVKGRTTDIDATFIDLLHRKIPKELFGLMGAFEARKGPFAVMTDLVYMKLGASDSVTRARSVHPNVGGTLSAAVSVQFEIFIAEAALAYEVLHWDGAAPGVQTSIDLYGGGRFW